MSLPLDLTHRIKTHRFLEMTESYTPRFYINTSIHTYPGFARRINLIQRMRASQNCDKKLSSDYSVQLYRFVDSKLT